MLIQQILPTIVNEQLADYIDIFCEEGYFSVKDAELVMAAGMLNGLRAKIHVNQFTVLGGIKAAVQAGALSVDHLEELSDADIVALQGSDTMPVALPGCSYFLGIPYTPARRIIDAGLPIALATDYNPGSAPSGNMNQVVSAACIKMKMTPEEAINAATLNGAYAMELENEMGSITVGKRANLLLTKAIPSSNFIPYAFGSTILDTVYVNGIEQ
jgi:imidazolonepropionase